MTYKAVEHLLEKVDGELLVRSTSVWLCQVLDMLANFQCEVESKSMLMESCSFKMRSRMKRATISYDLVPAS